MKRNCLGILAAAVLVGALAGRAGAQGAMPAGVEKTADGAVAAVGDGFVSVTVRTADVLHVQYAKDKAWFGHGSISALPAAAGEAVKFEVAAGDGRVTVATAQVKGEIDLQTGAVRFLDNAGKVILAEKQRTMEPAVVQGEKTNHVRQQWEADPAESLYGLGENQLGIMDIKNWDLDLWQHNGTVDSPFLVSSKGYGVLWDSTSLTRFGDLGAFVAMPGENLMDDAGKAGGLSSGPIANGNGPLANATTTATIAPAAGGGRRGGGNAGTRWEGKVKAGAAGDYQFQTYSNGSVRVWIDNKLVIDHFRQNWLAWYDESRVHLNAGEEVPLKVEWAPDGGGNTMKMAWKPPVADREAQGTSLWSEVGGGVDYYFCYGPKLDQVEAGFRNVTGRANMLPSWALGYWQSRDHYTTAQQSIDAVKEFRKREIPLDNIVQDWQYWPGASLETVGAWKLDPARYPDPVGWTKAIHDLHAHLMISVWGWEGAQAIPNTNYKEMLAKKWLLGAGGRQGERPFVDFFNPDAAKLYWDQINTELFSKGIDAWWLDAAEPDIADPPTLENMRTFMNPTAMGTGAKMLNGYPLMESKAVYEGQRGLKPDQRVFILTRSGYPGMQRYSAVVWSGDSTSTWTAMKQQITAGLGFSISGMPYWSMDIGGYQQPPKFGGGGNNPPRGQANIDEWNELNARWFEFGTFVPLMRVHGQGAREIYNFGDKAQQVMIKYDKLRYALMPYIYSLSGDVTQRDDTIMRPLVMDFAGDAAAREVTDEYMFGPAFLVNPVTTYQATSRAVYLPAGMQWYDFWTGAATEGGKTVDAAAAYDTMPLYIKAGSIVPTGPAVQYVGEKPAETVKVYVYTGADGAFSLYEDDGLTYQYEKDAFSRIGMKWNEASKTLTIGKRAGSFEGMLKERTFEVVFVGKAKAVGYSPEVQADKSVKYAGDAVEVKME